MTTAEPSTYRLQLASGAGLMFNEHLLGSNDNHLYPEKGFKRVDYYYFLKSVKCSVGPGNRHYFHQDSGDHDDNPKLWRLSGWKVLSEAPWSTYSSFLQIGCYTGYLNFVAAFSMGPNKVNHGLETDYKSFLGCRRRANEINTCFPKLREKISFPRFFNCHYSELQPHRRYSFIVCLCKTTIEDRHAIINSLLEPGGTLVTPSKYEIGQPLPAAISYCHKHAHPLFLGEQPIDMRSQEPTDCIVDLMGVPSLFDMSASAVSEAIMARIPVEDGDCNCIMADPRAAINSLGPSVEYWRAIVKRLHELLDRLCLPSTSDDETKSLTEAIQSAIGNFWPCIFANSMFLCWGRSIGDRRSSTEYATFTNFSTLGTADFKRRYRIVVQAMAECLSPYFKNRWEKYVSTVKESTRIPKVCQDWLCENVDLTAVYRPPLH